VDVGEMVYDQEEEDSLAQEGAWEGNSEKIDQAIEMQPADWSYKDPMAAVLLATDRLDEAIDVFDNAGQ
jgi:hypothetical protein